MTTLTFVKLCRVLALPIPHGDPRTWTDLEREREQQRLQAYDCLIRSRDVSTRVAPLLHEFASSAPQHETYTEALSRIVPYARRWLVKLEAELNRETSATEREKFLREQAESDPFINSNLTRDAFAGRIPAERETKPNEP
jgi:hypothetical protein